MFGFEFEIALEDFGIPARYIQQYIHCFIRNIICEIADRHRAGKLSQGQILVMPVTRPGLVHLTEN